MHHPELMHLLQRRGHLDDDVDGQALLEPAALVDDAAQALALHQLHRQVVEAAVAAVIHHLDDVGMVQPQGGPELLLEALQANGGGALVGGKQLQRDHLPGVLLAGLEDGAHAALADLLQQLVAADRL
jgi:hypothetical protein